MCPRVFRVVPDALILGLDHVALAPKERAIPALGNAQGWPTPVAWAEIGRPFGPIRGGIYELAGLRAGTKAQPLRGCRFRRLTVWLWSRDSRLQERSLALKSASLARQCNFTNKGVDNL